MPAQRYEGQGGMSTWMLWTPQPRHTLWDGIFAVYPNFCPEGEGHGQHEDEDLEDFPDIPMASLDNVEDIDESYPPPIPLDPWDEVDNISPSHDRQRTALDDMADGKKPLKNNHHHHAAKRTKNFNERRQAPRASTIQDHVLPTAPIPTSLNANTLPTAHGAYAAKVETKEEKLGSKKRRSLRELLAMGFTLVSWNGFDLHLLVDSQGRIFVVLAGQPPDPDYAAAVERVFQLLKLEGTVAAFPASLRHHRCGLFAVLNVRLSYGKGQTTPSFLHNDEYAHIVDHLMGNRDVKHMAIFASGRFLRTFVCLASIADAALSCLRTLGPPTLRLLPVWTFRHRDVLNVPFGWCAIQAAGHFDPTLGGHLVLWDIGLVVEFPAGALILLPSATIAHSNIPVQEGDKHVSFTQFTASGLLCYVDNGFRTEEYAQLLKKKDECWAMGLSLLSTLDELLDIDQAVDSSE
ncbi:hypothetical protein C8R44DRAFT_889049 [Mycena epipterygia]|nr:hypothetical protein C8R44DRAFT_889049 [Mycena epipterygia]